MDKTFPSRLFVALPLDLKFQHVFLASQGDSVLGYLLDLVEAWVVRVVIFVIFLDLVRRRLSIFLVGFRVFLLRRFIRLRYRVLGLFIGQFASLVLFHVVSVASEDVLRRSEELTIFVAVLLLRSFLTGPLFTEDELF